jgi:hypothetical protein
MQLKSSGWIAIAAVLVCCKSDDLSNVCVNPPCALIPAMIIHLTSAATGDTVSGATFRLAGAAEGSGPCQGSTCFVVGPPGTYTVTLEAPGFQPVVRTVTVKGSVPPCGCRLIETEQLDVALVPAG